MNNYGAASRQIIIVRRRRTPQLFIYHYSFFILQASALRAFEQRGRGHLAQVHAALFSVPTDNEGLGNILRGVHDLAGLLGGGQISARQMGLGGNIQVEDADDAVSPHDRAFS